MRRFICTKSHGGVNIIMADILTETTYAYSLSSYKCLIGEFDRKRNTPYTKEDSWISFDTWDQVLNWVRGEVSERWYSYKIARNIWDELEKLHVELSE